MASEDFGGKVIADAVRLSDGSILDFNQVDPPEAGAILYAVDTEEVNFVDATDINYSDDGVIAPEPPSGFTATPKAVSGTTGEIRYSIDLAWVAPLNDEDGDTLLGFEGYRLYANTTGTEAEYTPFADLDANTNSYELNGVQAGVTYYFGIVAIGLDNSESEPTEVSCLVPVGENFSSGVTGVVLAAIPEIGAAEVVCNPKTHTSLKGYRVQVMYSTNDYVQGGTPTWPASWPVASSDNSHFFMIANGTTDVVMQFIPKQMNKWMKVRVRAETFGGTGSAWSSDSNVVNMVMPTITYPAEAPTLSGQVVFKNLILKINWPTNRNFGWWEIHTGSTSGFTPGAGNLFTKADSAMTVFTIPLTIGADTYIKVRGVSADGSTSAYVTGGPYQGATVPGTELTVGTVTADVVRASWVYAGSVAASQIQAGTLNAGVVYAGTLSADKITTGILGATVISLDRTDDSNRVIISNSGIFGYNAGATKFALTRSGLSIGSGASISAPAITGGTMSSPNITGGTITGSYIYTADVSSGRLRLRSVGGGWGGGVEWLNSADSIRAYMRTYSDDANSGNLAIRGEDAVSVISPGGLWFSEWQMDTNLDRAAFGNDFWFPYHIAHSSTSSTGAPNFRVYEQGSDNEYIDMYFSRDSANNNIMLRFRATDESGNVSYWDHTFGVE